MEGTAVKELERLVQKATVVETDGRQFSPLDMKPIMYVPRPAPVKVRTLNALVDYLTSNVDEVAIKDTIVLVEDAENVKLMSKLSGPDRRRDCFIEASAEGPRFQFGKWMSAEEFIIAVNALIIQSEKRDSLLKYVSSLKVESSAGIDDDGVAQAASVRVGVRGGLTDKAPAPSRIALRPFRTFAEVEQPESDFIFRMRTNGDSGVFMALFEADGGWWELDARQNVYSYLSEKFAEMDEKPSIIS